MKKIYVYFTLAIALVLATVPLSAGECCCTCCCVPVSQCVNTQNNGGTAQQAEQEVECESELSENDEKNGFGSRLKASFSDPVDPFEGPLYILASPLLGFIGPGIANAFHENSFWECVYNHIVGTPCGTLGFLSAGILKTMTLGKFSNGRIIGTVFDFALID